MKCKCEQCGYEWESRVKNPKQCTRCKRWDWNTKQFKYSKEDKNEHRR